MKLRKIKSKKAQLNSTFVFVVVILTLLFLAPILMKLVVAPTTKVISAFNTIDATNKSSNAMTFAVGKFTGMFDWVLMFFFIFNIILVLITAFLVDVHPAFLAIYIIGIFFLILFAPTVLDAMTKMWDMPQFSVGADNVVQYLPLMNFVRNNFTWLILGVIVLSGLIMFGKYRFGSQASGGGNYY